jgi:hypothetical protein
MPAALSGEGTGEAVVERTRTAGSARGDQHGFPFEGVTAPRVRTSSSWDAFPEGYGHPM